MKKIILLISVSLFYMNSSAQDLKDAYRYSSEELAGTARFKAMSGAFGALGGDISAMAVNPASSAVFLSSTASVSLNYRKLDASTNYFGGRSSGQESDFELGSLGGVFIFNSSSNSDWKKISLGLNYNTSQSYEEQFTAKGISQTSIDRYFLNYANGVPLDLLKLRSDESISDLYSFLGENNGFAAQQAFLGYQGFITEPVEDQANNSEYFSLIEPGNFDQRYSYNSTGLNGKLTFNAGTQYKDFLFLGINLNSHFISYENTIEFNEFNSNSGSETNEVYFDNYLSTDGEGFSFQLGAIGKINDFIRVGLTYDSPTWYTIREETTQFLQTYSDKFDESTVISPNVLNVYPEYRLKTPGEITGSLAFLFGKKGLVSFDYSRKDYSNIKFKPANDPAYEDLNSQVSDKMDAASTFRIGGEYRIQKFSLRAGFSHEDSPFKDEDRLGQKQGYSGGIGYDFGNFNIDVAYNHLNYEENRPLYNVGLTNRANIDRDLSRFTLSLSFGL